MQNEVRGDDRASRKNGNGAAFGNGKGIEEKIRELQQAKSGLADIVLSGGENSGNIMSMTSEEILELLK